ncbi:GNAT family N-acetyltransferase [Catenuloplanes japonicus]|uniref:GNAT family N-acetyltransferase n=1 Tax=Catenuloplanes japonicus TaxID=33876 RepID=UPI00052429BC|nr:GNAT family N-acetyltransferase [Catenuloplanes japonicus]
MSREVTEGLAEAVVAAGAPPEPKLSAPWSLRPAASDEDVALVARWMAAPHVDLFWEQAWPVARWRAAIDGQLGGDYSRPYVVSYEDAPLAYVEIYRVARDVVGLQYDADAHDLGIHLAIGERASTGRGLGRAMVRAVADGLFEADPRCAVVVADPDERHGMARRMFAGAGFTLWGVRDLGHKRAAILRYVRPAV